MRERDVCFRADIQVDAIVWLERAPWSAACTAALALADAMSTAIPSTPLCRCACNEWGQVSNWTRRLRVHAITERTTELINTGGLGEAERRRASA